MTQSWFRSEPCVVCDPVPEFLADYLAHRIGHVDAVVDLWADSGRLLTRLAARTGVGHAVGVCSTPEVAATLAGEAGDIDWQVADPAGPAVHVAATPDVVIGLPPWHWAPRHTERLGADGRPVRLTDDPANVAVVDACVALSERGVGCFVVGPGVLMRPGPGTIMANLDRFGLHLDGVVELPRGTIRPDHGAAQILLMVSKIRRPEPIFGRLDPQPGAFARLLDAAHARSVAG